jgi:hypothetical protein
MRQAIEYVMDSLRHQVDLKWVNLTINDVRCQGCGKYPVIGRILQGPKAEPLCEQCFTVASPSFPQPAPGRPLMSFLFKRGIEHEAEKRAYIRLLCEMGASPERLEWLVQQYPRKTVEEFLELATEF